MSQPHISVIWADGLSLNALCLGVIRLNRREVCVKFPSNMVSSQLTRIMVFTHVLQCMRFCHVNMDVTQKTESHFDGHSPLTTWFGNGSLQVPGIQT